MHLKQKAPGVALAIFGTILGIAALREDGLLPDRFLPEPGQVVDSTDMQNQDEIRKAVIATLEEAGVICLLEFCARGKKSTIFEALSA
jgi:hypothetical protein